jgi:hypothetical protein
LYYYPIKSNKLSIIFNKLKSDNNLFIEIFNKTSKTKDKRSTTKIGEKVTRTLPCPALPCPALPCPALPCPPLALLT